MTIDIYSKIFYDVEEMYKFFIKREIIILEKLCDVGCDGVMKLIIYLKEKKYILYRFQKCRKRQSAFKTNIKHEKLLLCIFILMINSTYHQIYLFTGICDKKILLIKKYLAKCDYDFLIFHLVHLEKSIVNVKVDKIDIFDAK